MGSLFETAMTSQHEDAAGCLRLYQLLPTAGTSEAVREREKSAWGVGAAPASHCYMADFPAEASNLLVAACGRGQAEIWNDLELAILTHPKER